MPTATVQRLIERGVTIPAPEMVCVSPEIDPRRIAPSVRLLPGSSLRGRNTSIGPDCVLGSEGPATLDNCQLGSGVELKAGFFSESVFLDGVAIAACAHVRPGCLLEEGATCGHSVGLKHTVLMPFVTLGSQINFCDCLMAGGTGPRNHSEVGSSFVHFNFTAHQDKAAPSLFGDVPRGVLLDRPPVFLGGQGGVVGPSRMEYGTVLAAGTVYRRDVTEPGKLVFGQFGRSTGLSDYHPALYGDIRRIVHNNLVYIGNAIALREWYRHARPLLTTQKTYATACLDGASHVLRVIVDERLARMRQLESKVHESLDIAGRQLGSDQPDNPCNGQEDFVNQWEDCAARIASFNPETCATGDRDRFLNIWSTGTTVEYVDAIQVLEHEAKASAQRWLQTVVDRIVALGPHLG